MSGLRNFSVTIGIVIFILMTGCSGGGGSSVPDTFIKTTYEGFVQDARFGRLKIGVDLFDSSRFPGRVSPYVSVYQFDPGTERLSEITYFNVFEENHTYGEDHVPLTNGMFSALMGTWPEGIPVSNLEKVICKLSIKGALQPDLNPGSKLNLKYQSSDCNFISSGSLSMDFIDKMSYSQ